jgi:phosphoglycolate phosphatase-like HAD superfamily hydrolase
MFNAIIWDFDGTLCDTYPEIARTVNEALAVFGKTASLDRVVGLSSISLAFCITELSQEFALSREALNEAFERSYETVNPEDQKPFLGVLEVCKKVQILGGQNFIVTHRREKSLSVLLATHDIHSYFTDIVAGDDGFPKKPDPAAMLHLIRKHRLEPANVLVIGDRPIDILAGQSVGAKTCLFGASFPGVVPDFRIDAFSELLALL